MRLASSSSGRPSFATEAREDEAPGVAGKEGKDVEEEDGPGGGGG